ncbi:MAG: ribosomal-processing cysteine protease Prp [Vagococcus sp.]
MIQANFKQNSRNDFVAFDMSGHANSGPYGYDLVCAACSALSINTVNSLEKLAKYTPIVVVDEGYLKFEIPEELTDAQQTTTNLLVHSLMIGLQAIEDEHNQFIQVKSK